MYSGIAVSTYRGAPVMGISWNRSASAAALVLASDWREMLRKGFLARRSGGEFGNLEGISKDLFSIPFQYLFDVLYNTHSRLHNTSLIYLPNAFI